MGFNMKRYSCVNCGYTGEFKIYRQRNIKCESCGYDDLTELDEEDWKEYGKEKHEMQQKDPYYQKRIKENG